MGARAAWKLFQELTVGQKGRQTRAYIHGAATEIMNHEGLEVESRSLIIRLRLGMTGNAHNLVATT